MGRHVAARGTPPAVRPPAPGTQRARHAARPAPAWRGLRFPHRRDLAALGGLSLLTGLVVGWQPPLFFANTAPAAASTPSETPPQVIERAPTAEPADRHPTDSADSPDAAPDAVSAVFIPESERRTITIAGVGDILVHREIIAQALQDGGGTVDFGPQLEGIRPIIESADLAICHMEFPLGSAEGPWTAWPDLPNSPPQLAQTVANLGFDACSTASNHTLDQGMAGVASTIDALAAAGLPHAGSAASEEDAARITLLDVEGVSVGLLSYTYSFNGIPRPYEWCCNLMETDAMIADAQRAREAGAQLVVIALHHGVEGIAPPTQSQREVVQALADSGQVDLVLGHHAHVVQPVTKVGDMWVAYGHGNLLSAQSRRDPRTGDGLVTTFTFAEQVDGTFRGIDAVGYAVANHDYPFRLSPVTAYAAPGGRDDATWRRMSEQAVIPGDASGFRLVRFGG
jgi:hypothetical protein